MIDATITHLFCPYCGTQDLKDNFLTEDQLEYLKSVAIQKVMRKLGTQLKGLERQSTRNAFLSLDIKVKVPDPKINKYFEKESRRNIRCNNCGREYSIYGVSFYCPFCGPRDAFSVFEENRESIKRLLSLKESLQKDEDLVRTNKVRELEEMGVFSEIYQKMLDKAVTTYETYMKNKYIDEMMKLDPSKGIPYYQKRVGNKFQNIDKTHDLLLADKGFDFKSKIAPTDNKSLNLGLQKRHIIVHNSGVIDEKYCQNTGEPRSLVGNRLTISKKEVLEFISTISKIIGLIEGTL